MNHFDSIRFDTTIKSGVYDVINEHIWTKVTNPDNKYADENVDVAKLELIIEALQGITADCQSLRNRL